MRTQGQVALLNALELALEKNTRIVLNFHTPLEVFEVEIMMEQLTRAFDRGTYGVYVPYSHTWTDNELRLYSMRTVGQTER